MRAGSDTLGSALAVREIGGQPASRLAMLPWDHRPLFTHERPRLIRIQALKIINWVTAFHVPYQHIRSLPGARPQHLGKHSAFSSAALYLHVLVNVPEVGGRLNGVMDTRRPWGWLFQPVEARELLSSSPYPPLLNIAAKKRC